MNTIRRARSGGGEGNPSPFRVSGGRARGGGASGGRAGGGRAGRANGLLLILGLGGLLLTTGALPASASHPEQTPPVATLEARADPVRDTIPDPDHTGLQGELHQRLTHAAAEGAAGRDGRLYLGGRPLRSGDALLRFYRERDFAPVWRMDDSADRIGLHRALRSVSEDRFDPNDYHADTLAELFRDLVVVRDESQDGESGEGQRSGAGGESGEGNPGAWADAELLLTDAALHLIHHLAHGRLDPRSLNRHWTAPRSWVDPVDRLSAAIPPSGRLGPLELAGILDDLRPPGPGYQTLLAEAYRLDRIVADGGWPRIPDGPTLDPGDRHARVALLRERLQAGGDLPGITGIGGPAAEADPELYDDELEAAVRRFQERHGLGVDARVGPATLRALNVSAAERLRQVEVGLERWRWLPRERTEREIRVNVAAHTVHIYDDGDESLAIRAIVGRTDRPTPLFSGRMTYLVLAPYWNVPPTLAIRDQLPKIRADLGHLAREGIQVLDQATGARVDPATVDWQGISGPEFNRRYRLRQDPGPRNAMGHVKFMFPNRHNVYLHDTPDRHLFAQPGRALSSGCIRIEGALEVAKHLLREQAEWNRDRIDSVIAAGRERNVVLARPYLIHLEYRTAFVGADGVVQFRDDIYRLDPAVGEALARGPGGSSWRNPE